MQLSDMEYRILTALAAGRQSKEISATVGRSRATVETHVRLLFARFDARSRAHLVALAIAAKVIDPPGDAPFG